MAVKHDGEDKIRNSFCVVVNKDMTWIHLDVFLQRR